MKIPAKSIVNWRFVAIRGVMGSSNYDTDLLSKLSKIALGLGLFALNVMSGTDVDVKTNSSTVLDQRVYNPMTERLELQRFSFVVLNGEILQAWDVGGLLAGQKARVAGISWPVAAYGAGVADILSKGKPFREIHSPTRGDEPGDFYYNRRGYFRGR